MFTILPRNVFGAMGGDKKYVAPSDQLTRGIIGVGGIGMSGLHFVSDERCRLVSVCDVDRNHLDNALKKGVEKFGTKLQAYTDWRISFMMPTWTSYTSRPLHTGTESWPSRPAAPVRTYSARSR